MTLLIAILAILFTIFFLIVWLSGFSRFICYYLSDYFHFKLFGDLLFDPETPDFLLLTILDKEYEQIKMGQKAEDHLSYRISFMVYHYTTIIIRYTVLPFIIVAILFFTLIFIYEDMFI